jgi:prephenate dehydrogenase
MNSPEGLQGGRRDETRGYDTVCIVGLGLIGGSLALAIRQAGYQGRILGVSSPDTLSEARKLAVVDEGAPYEGLADAASRADLVVLASPISAIVEHIRTLGKASLRPGGVVTDVGSTKRAILRTAAESLREDVVFIGGHPLAGSEARGIAAADPFLFQNAYYVLTPAPEAAPADVARLGRFLGTTGARIMVLSAEEHDRVAATISHLPQILAVSLVRFLDDLGPDRESGIHLAAGGFRDMTRIASSPFSVWRDIIATNRDVIEDVGRRFLRSALDVVESLGEAESAFEGAARTRAEIPRDSKGFLHRLWDVLVVVEDRPGVIACIAEPLAANGLNINDIEVLKVREGEGGTLRLAFGSQEGARKAIRILEQAGYRARLRD